METKSVQNDQHKMLPRIAETILLLVLFFWPFLHISTGIDLTDTGYGLANFEAFPNLNVMWCSSTFLSLALGKLFTFLPGGHTYIGMYAYCCALSGIMVLTIYFLLRKYYSWYVVYIGLLSAVFFSWAPKTCVYQYMSYYLLDIVAVLLLKGLIEDKRKLLISSGIILAIASFIRFPNVAYTGLILILFFYGILYKKNIFKQFLVCLISYIVTFILGILIIELTLGNGAYLEMIGSLFTVSDTASGYGMTDMLFNAFIEYLDAFKWYLVIILFAVADYFLFRIFQKRKLNKLWMIAQVPGFAGVYLVLLKLWAFNLDYSNLFSIKNWGVFIILTGIILSIFNLINKNNDKSKRLIAFAVLIVILITPLGSNNGAFSLINNLFLIFVYIVKESLSELDFISIFKIGETNKFVAVKVTMILLVLFASAQALIFSVDYSFRDAGFLSDDLVAVTKNPVLKNVRTNKTNANDIEELSDFIYSNGYNGQKAIFYGNVPMLSYALKMPCAISHSWPDLESYSARELKNDLDNLSDCSLIIYGLKTKDYYDNDLVDITQEKKELLSNYINDHNYVEIFRNNSFVVLKNS